MFFCPNWKIENKVLINKSCFLFQKGRSSAKGSGHPAQAEAIQGPFKNLGKGLCRGEDWNLDDSWPQDGKQQSVENCGIKCESTPGCNAFDVSNYKIVRQKNISS